MREPRLPTFAGSFIEREARNRSLGLAGEELVIQFEQERLIRAGCERLAARIEHTSRVRGDHEGYDILSFETDGAERLIEVKTTKYGKETRSSSRATRWPCPNATRLGITFTVSSASGTRRGFTP